MQRGWIIWAVLILIAAAPATAAGVELALVPPRGTIKGGDTVFLNLFLHNHGDAAVVQNLPSSLPCRVDTDKTTLDVTAELIGGTGDSTAVAIPGGGFAKRQYRLTLPVYAVGPVSLTLGTLDVNPVILSVEKAPPEMWVGQQVPLNEEPTMLQSFLDDFSVYQPMYFLLSVDPELEQSKFQFSFKYRLFNPKGYLAEKAPWVSGFHLAYTQRSIWDLKSDSKPFEDTSYMPEVFYLLPKIDLNIQQVSAFGVQGGFQHESNGKGGTDSRSTNYLYIEPTLGLHLMGPYHLNISPKIFTYVANEDQNNGDLADYRGYFDLALGIIDPEGVALSSHLWWAEAGPTVQLDLSYPMNRLLGKNLNFYLQAEYFSGYAETLLHYDQRQDVFRLGFSIVR